MTFTLADVIQLIALIMTVVAGLFAVSKWMQGQVDRLDKDTSRRFEELRKEVSTRFHTLNGDRQRTEGAIHDRIDALKDATYKRTDDIIALVIKQKGNDD